MKFPFSIIDFLKFEKLPTKVHKEEEEKEEEENLEILDEKRHQFNILV